MWLLDGFELASARERKRSCFDLCLDVHLSLSLCTDSFGFFFFFNLPNHAYFICSFVWMPNSGRESDELIVLTGFCFCTQSFSSSSSRYWTWVLPTMHKKRLETCVFFSPHKIPRSRWWLFMLEIGAVEPSSAEEGPWFVSACCALALSSPSAGVQFQLRLRTFQQ